MRDGEPTAAREQSTGGHRGDSGQSGSNGSLPSIELDLFAGEPDSSDSFAIELDLSPEIELDLSVGDSSLNVQEPSLELELEEEIAVSTPTVATSTVGDLDSKPDIELDLFPIEMRNETWDDVAFLTGNAEEIELDLQEEEDEAVDSGQGSYSTREGLDLPHKESLFHFMNFSLLRLRSLEKSITSNVSYNDSDSRTLLNAVMGSREMPFLTSEDKAYLLSLLEGTDSEEQIFKIFLQDRYLDRRNKLELMAYIRQIVTRFKTYQDKTALLANIRSNINKIILAEFIKDPTDSLEVFNNYQSSDNICYVSWIREKSRTTQYGCGNCGAQVEGTQGFFRALVSDSNFSKNESVFLFPLAQVCPHCDFLNLVTSLEHQSLANQINSKYNSTMAEWRRSDEKLTSYGNMIIYRMPKSVYVELKPDLYIPEIVDALEEEEELAYDYQELLAWYEETKRLVAKMESRNVSVSGGFYIDDDGRQREYKEDHRRKTADLVAQYCSMFRENYSKVKQDSVNSLLSFLRDNPTLYNSLNPEIVYQKEALLYSRGYVGEDVEITQEDLVYKSIAAQLGINYDPVFVDGNLDKEWLCTFKISLTGEFDKLAEKYEQSKELLKEAHAQLDNLVELYRFVDIRNNLTINLSNFAALLSYPGFVDWMDYVSDLMVLNRMSEEIAKFWKTLPSPGKNTHKSLMDSTRLKKSVADQITALFKDYNARFKSEQLESSPIDSVNNFLSSGFTDSRLAGKMYNLKLSIEHFDYYLFCKTVMEISQTVFPKVRSFAQMNRFIDHYKNEALQFIEHRKEHGHDNELLDYHVYHYGHLFTSEEIISGAQEFQGMNKQPFQLSRNEGENFITYLRRLRNVQQEDPGVKLDRELHKFDGIRLYIPSIYGAFEYFKFYTSTKGKVRYSLLMNDLLYYSYYYGERYMYRFLGITKLPVQTINYFEDRISAIPDAHTLRINYILSNLVYPSIDFAQAIEDTTNGAPTVLAMLQEDVNRVEEEFKYLQPFGEEVYELYFGGREELSVR